MGLLDGRVLLVSGGTQGVGAGVALAAAAAGATVAVSGRSAERGEKLAGRLRESGAAAPFVPTDLTDVAQARASVATVIAEFGRVDALVNAAGMTSRGTLLDTTPELFDAQVAVNLRAPFFLMQAVVAHLVERGRTGGHRQQLPVVGVHELPAHPGTGGEVGGDGSGDSADRLDDGAAPTEETPTWRP